MTQMGWVVKIEPQLQTRSELAQTDDNEKKMLQKIQNYLLDLVVLNDITF